MISNCMNNQRFLMYRIKINNSSTTCNKFKNRLMISTIMMKKMMLKTENCMIKINMLIEKPMNSTRVNLNNYNKIHLSSKSKNNKKNNIVMNLMIDNNFNNFHKILNNNNRRIININLY